MVMLSAQNTHHFSCGLSDISLGAFLLFYLYLAFVKVFAEPGCIWVLCLVRPFRLF